MRLAEVNATQELIGEAPLLEFALVSGFAVQSHMVRHFRERIGVSPAIFQSLQQL
jgi:AraC-like DNA-binding protein